MEMTVKFEGFENEKREEVLNKLKSDGWILLTSKKEEKAGGHFEWTYNFAKQVDMQAIKF